MLSQSIKQRKAKRRIAIKEFTDEFIKCSKDRI